MKAIPVRRLGTGRAALRFAEEFNIRPIDEVLAGTDMVQDLHRHDHYFLLALSKGKGVHEADFTAYPLEDRVLYFMRPGQVHRLTLKAGCRGYIMQFKADFYAPGDPLARQVLRRAGNAGRLKPDGARFDTLFVVLERIRQEYARQQPDFAHLIRAYMGVLFAELVLRAPEAAQQRTKAGSYALERSEELQELIEAHVHRTKEVSAYADLMHLSTYQLNAIARAGTGRTCSALITDQIILEAKRYLLATSDQVNQVADRLGYEDVSYFIRFFKRHTGHTPEAFRRKSR